MNIHGYEHMYKVLREEFPDVVIEPPIDMLDMHRGYEDYKFVAVRSLGAGVRIANLLSQEGMVIDSSLRQSTKRARFDAKPQLVVASLNEDTVYLEDPQVLRSTL